VTTETYVITVPETPKSVNQGGGGVRAAHWGVAFKEKERWQQTFMQEFMVAGMDKDMVHCKVDVTLRFKNRNRRDLENYRHPVMKPLADALVAGGWLQDDTEEWFVVEGFRMESGVELSMPRPNPRQVYTKSEMIVKLEASYA